MSAIYATAVERVHIQMLGTLARYHRASDLSDTNDPCLSGQLIALAHCQMRRNCSSAAVQHPRHERYGLAVGSFPTMCSPKTIAKVSSELKAT